MAPPSRADARAVLLVAALARAVAAGEPSCGRDEVCAPQDVEALEQASVDALRVELLQSGGRLLPAGGSARRGAPEGGPGAHAEPAELSANRAGTPNVSLLQSASSDMPGVCARMMSKCGCRSIPTEGSRDYDADFGTSADVYKFDCYGNSICWVYTTDSGAGYSSRELCPYPGTWDSQRYRTDDGKPAIARTCCSGDMRGSSYGGNYYGGSSYGNNYYGRSSYYGD